MKLRPFLLALLPCSMLLSGCLGELLETTCPLLDDADHCYQSAAVQSGDDDGCDKILGQGFTGSNPPKDKCFLQIAENTGDISACDRIEGGMMSYSKEECLSAVFRSHTVESCANAEDEMACRTSWAKNGKSCGEGFAWTDGACIVTPDDAGSSSSSAGSDDGIDDTAQADVQTIADALKGKYMELLDADIDGETDPDRLAGLQAYKDFLGKVGETADTAQTSWDKLQELKKIFVDSYDSSMDIDKMSVEKILAPGLFDRLRDKLLGADEPTGLAKENAAAENALTVYETMLKRQQDIDFLKKDKLGRLGDTIVSTLKSDATDKLTDAAKNAAEGIAGTAFSAVGIVGDALQSFQDEAQKQMFLGLARAYNRRRETLEQQRPDLSAEDRHALAVRQVQDDPYQDNTQLAVIKHGNILENKDCQDDSNPLCIDGRVWWTAMDKTYEALRKPRR